MVGYERSADRDVVALSFASPGVSTTRSLSPSSLTLSSSSPISSPSFLIMFSPVDLRAWFVVYVTIGGICVGSAHEAAVVSSVDAGVKLGSTSHMQISFVMGSQWELNAAGSRSQ